MRRRTSALILLGLCGAILSCNDLGSAGTGTPVGIVLMDARTQATGYTTYPTVNFYSVSSATFSFATVVSDTCVVAPYDSAAVPAAYPNQIGGGPFLIMSLSGITDSLYKANTGDQTYHPTLLTGVPFNPGDSVTFEIAGDAAGFPQMLSATSRTAEPFTITRPVIPPSGQNMIVSWTAASDNNAAMYLSLLYNTGGGTTLNTQVFCDFRDTNNGAGIAQGTVQSYLIPALESSTVPFVVHAQRLRTALILASEETAYLNIISTFEVPTPVSP